MKLKAMTLALFATGLLAGLTLIAPATGADAPATATTTTATVYGSASGPIAALSATSITVNDLTCTRSSSSPSLEGYKVGDQVGLGCANGVVIVVADKRAPAPTTTTSTTTTAAPQGAGARDPINALSATSITVGPLTCSIGPSSPSVAFKVGDRVRMGCLGGVMVYVVADLDLPTTTTTTTSAPPVTTTNPVVTRGGTLTAIGEHSITVDSLTCYLYPTSPSLTGFKVGDHVGVACQSNVLIKIVALAGDQQTTTTTTSTGQSHDELQTAYGPIRALSSTSITVDGLTCSIGSSSPSVADFKLGNQVGIGCSKGALVRIGALPGTSDRHADLKTRLGAITALSAGSITVDGLTCSIGSGSPSVAGFKLGDKVGIGCSNGVLVKLGIPQNDDDHGFGVAVQLGAITSLRGDGITVGALSCKLADTSPSVASFKLGDRVGIGCAGGILFMIGALPSADSAPKAEVKHALVERFHGCIKRGAERCVVGGVVRRISYKK
jgi:hypothetical protein